MDSSYVTALAALAGSVIGGLSSFATTWLVQNAKYRQDQVDKDKNRRESLYGAFIDEASRLFADAIHHQFEDSNKFVKLYSLISRMRLFASTDIIASAESMADTLIKTYRAPDRQFSDFPDTKLDEMDPLREFSEACRKELASM